MCDVINGIWKEGKAICLISVYPGKSRNSNGTIGRFLRIPLSPTYFLSKMIQTSVSLSLSTERWLLRHRLGISDKDAEVLIPSQLPFHSSESLKINLVMMEGWENKPHSVRAPVAAQVLFFDGRVC